MGIKEYLAEKGGLIGIVSDELKKKGVEPTAKGLTSYMLNQPGKAAGAVIGSAITDALDELAKRGYEFEIKQKNEDSAYVEKKEVKKNERNNK